VRSRSLALAVGTLTVLRVPVVGRVERAELAASTAWYPLVGLGVGLVPAAMLLLPLPPLPRAALALAAWVAVTGALHLDGWADCCDAAFAPGRADAAATRERRLAILRDPHLGTFGTVGLVLLLLGKWTALAHVPAFAPLVAAPVARWGMVRALHAHPPARADGLGAAFAGGVPLGWASAALASVLLALLLLTPAPLRMTGAAAAGVVAAMGAAAFLARRFGGVTGDVCGAAGEAAELAALWVWLPWALA
jgi:adenosylcobinamide-GDP ribazoletransferase